MHKIFRSSKVSYELKLVTPQVLRECDGTTIRDTPELVAEYFRENIETSEQYDPMREQFVVIFVNTRRRVIGFSIVGLGTLSGVFVDPASTYRAAIVTGAAAIFVAHNHPSGDASPSNADVHITRELMRAGRILKIELLDSIIIGQKTEQDKGYKSLRELGYLNL
jgi:DNA repair protein RadC